MKRRIFNKAGSEHYEEPVIDSLLIEEERPTYPTLGALPARVLRRLIESESAEAMRMAEAIGLGK
jgi:hypothetical protein